MKSDVHMTDYHHSPRDTIKKRKRNRVSDQHVPQPTRQHQRKTSLENRSFSINTRRSLDFVRPAELEQRCYDWIVQTKGVHYSRNKAWFSTYSPVNIQLENGLWCQGVGLVHLDVRIQQSPGGEGGFRTVVLNDVLHLPKAVCNGFSLAVSSNYVACEAGLKDSNRGSVLLLDALRGLNKLSLLGSPNGESPLAEMLEDELPSRLLDLGHCLTDSDILHIKDIVTPRLDTYNDDVMCQNGS